MNLTLDGKRISPPWKISMLSSKDLKKVKLEYDDGVVLVWAHLIKKNKIPTYECFSKDPTAKEPVVQEVPDMKRKYTRKARK